MLDLSASVAEGAGSATLAGIPVVTRRVLGRAVAVLGVSDGVVFAGVVDRGLHVPGVPTPPKSKIGVADFSGIPAATDGTDVAVVTFVTRLGSTSRLSDFRPPSWILSLVSAVATIGDSSLCSGHSFPLLDDSNFLSASGFRRVLRTLGEPRLISPASWLVFLPSRAAGLCVD